MNKIADYRNESRRRDKVISIVVPEKERSDVDGVLKGLELSLVVSKNGGAFRVSRDGTEVLNNYIKKLELYIFSKIEGLNMGSIGGTTCEVKVECPHCNTKNKKQSNKIKSCLYCNNSGFILELKNV